MRIEYKKRAVKYIEALDRPTKQRIKAAILAWDPDFTKLTASERRELEQARSEEETVSHDEINWD